jgi:3-hydroxyacyl-[acyl-carrier-protein] dehydratase
VRFLLIDEILELDPGRRAVARKTFPEDEELFDDHFPGYPVVPGVLLTEAMGQTAGWVIAHASAFRLLPLLSMVQQAKFRRPVRPGEELRLEAEVEAGGARRWRARTRALVGGRRVAEARLAYHALETTAAEELAGEEALRDWVEAIFTRLSGGRKW